MSRTRTHRALPVEVEAVQLTRQTFPDVLELIPREALSAAGTGEAGGELYVRIRSGVNTLRAALGWWVIRLPGGGWDVRSDAEFRELYEPVEGR